MSTKPYAIREINTADIHVMRESAFVPDTCEDLADLINFNLYRLENPEYEIAEYKLKEVKPLWDKLDEHYGKSSTKFVIMYLYFYMGFSYRQIESILHISFVACYRHAMQAITYLKGEFSDDKLKG